MITDVDEASLQVVVLELLGGVVLGLTRGGAVDDEVTDGVGGHEDAGLDVCEEFVLGGDLVATDGKRECFLDHRLLRLRMLILFYSLAMQEVMQKRLAIVVMMVITALKIS